MNQMSVILYILAMGEVTSGGMDKEGQHHRNYLVGEAKKSYINVHVNVGSIKNGKNCKTPRDKTSMEETSPPEETSSSNLSALANFFKLPLTSYLKSISFFTTPSIQHMFPHLHINYHPI